MDRSRRRDQRDYASDLNGGSLPVNDGNTAYYPRYFPQWIWGSDRMSYNPTDETQYYTVAGGGSSRQDLGHGYYAGGNVYDNVGYMGHKQPRGFSYKLKQPSSETSGETFHPDNTQRASSRRCCVVLSIVGLVFLVAAGIGIGIYFGVVDKPESSVSQTTPVPVSAVSFDAQLTMDDGVYTSNLDDPTSAEFQALKQQTEAEIDSNMEKSSLAGSFMGANVYAFSPGSIEVHVNVQFRTNKFVNVNSQVVLITAAIFIQELQTELNRSGTSLFNTNSIVANVASVLSRSRLGEDCLSESDCFNLEAVCQGTPISTCVCDSIYYDSNGDHKSGACLPKLAYDQAGCNDADLQCLVSNAECITGRCLCNANTFLYNDACVPLIEIGQSGCIDLYDSCSTLDAACVFGVCECSTLQYHDGIEDSCKSKIDNGMGCTLSSECLYTGAECNGVCECPDITYAVSITKTCTPNKPFSASCSGDDECPIDAVCSGQQCACTFDKYENSTRCSDKKGNLVTCQSVAECLFTGAECDDVCQCPIGTYENGTMCTAMVEYGEPCTAVKQCKTQHSFCDNDTLTCSCLDTQFFSNDMCNDKLGDGENCTANHECSYSQSICLSNECTCPDGRFVNNAELSCDLQVINGEVCTDPLACKYDRAVCDGTCGCPESLYENVDLEACFDKKAVGGSCSADVECLMPQDVVCSYNLCTCINGTYWDGSVCQPQKDLGADCGLEIECLFDNAVCDSVCACLDDMYSNGLDCVDKIPYNSPCTDTAHCASDGSSCQNDRCLCDITEYYDQTTDACYNKLVNGEECVSTSHCLVADAVCDTTCKCLSTNYEDQSVPGGACTSKLDIYEACTSSEQCSTANSTCTNTCVCEEDYFYEATNNACTMKLDIDGVCTALGQCRYTDAQCTVGLCKCQQGTYVDDITEACLPRLAFSDACTFDEQCPFDGLCSAGLICACPPERYQDGDRCSLLKDNQVQCGSEDECLFDAAECDTVCKCPVESYEENTSCVHLVVFGGACTGGYQCSTQHSECINQMCDCADTAFYNTQEDKCSDKLGDGESCTLDNECSYNQSICLSNQCTCPGGTFVNNAQQSCDQQVINGEVCIDILACKYDRAVCDGTCGCPESLYENMDSEACLDKKANGALCSVDDECAALDAYCENVCMCSPTDFLDESDLVIGPQCTPKLEQGENCTLSEQCRLDHAICSVDDICDCDDSMFEFIDACVDKSLNGESCNGDGECLVLNATCIQGICGCSDEDFIEGNECKAKLPNGEACLSDSYCWYENAACIEDVCDCPDGLLLDETSCTSMIDIDGQCVDETWCSTTNALCTGTPTTCKCDFDHYHDSETNICTTKLAYGASGCVNSALQCMTGEAICSDTGTCTCDDDFFLSHASCMRRKPIGQLCSDVSECITLGSMCNISCKCPTGMYDDGIQCEYQVGFGEGCTMDKQCMTRSGRCSTTCGCMENYIHDTNSDQCVIKKSYNESCSNIVDECITENAVCDAVTSMCLCPDNTLLADTICIPLKALDEICLETEECGVEGSTCEDVCMCPSGTYYDTSCRPQIDNGESCNNDMECLFTGAGCYGNLCACPEKTYESGTSCLSDKLFGGICMADMECGTEHCIDNICGCPETHYYDNTTEQCFTYLGYGESCNMMSQCGTANAECSGTCVCPVDWFFSNNVCMEKIGDGEPCFADEQCNYTDAICSDAGQCMCGNDSYINNRDRICELKKLNDELCESTQECATPGAECDFVCQCPDNTYENVIDNRTVCSPKKLNGVTCEAEDECLIPGAECNVECLCPPTMFLYDNACIDRLEFEDDCMEDGDCIDEFICLNTTCSCQPDYEYNDINLTCVYAPPTTPLPTTPAPDVDVVVDVEGEIVIDTPYNINLTDPNSAQYQAIENAALASFEDQIARDPSIAGVAIEGMIPGSIMVVFKLQYVKGVLDLGITIETTGDVEDYNSALNNVLAGIVNDLLSNAVESMNELGELGNVELLEEATEVQENPCIDDIKYMELAESGICYGMTQYLQSSSKKQCGVQYDLYNCIKIYLHKEGLECDWNVVRTNFVKYTLKGIVKKRCNLKASGDMNPIGGAFNIENPCNDLSMMTWAAKYFCRSYYTNIAGGKEKCSNGVDIVNCSAEKLENEFMCTVSDAFRTSALTAMLDYQEEIFGKKKKKNDLTTCEFCVAPAIFNVWTKECKESLREMDDKMTEEKACLNLHVGLKCVEEFTRDWVNCGMDSLHTMLKSDMRFLYEAQRRLPWLTYEKMNMCLDHAQFSECEMNFNLKGEDVMPSSDLPDEFTTTIILQDETMTCGMIHVLAEHARTTVEQCEIGEIQHLIRDKVATKLRDMGVGEFDFSHCPVVETSSEKCTETSGMMEVLKCLAKDSPFDDQTKCRKYKKFRKCVLKNREKSCGAVDAIQTLRHAISVMSPFICQTCIDMFDDPVVCPVVEPSAVCDDTQARCSSHGRKGYCCFNGCTFVYMDTTPNEGFCPLDHHECGDYEMSCMVDGDCYNPDEKCCHSDCGEICKPAEYPDMCYDVTQEMVKYCMINMEWDSAPWEICGFAVKLMTCIHENLHYFHNGGCTTHAIISQLYMLKDGLLHDNDASLPERHLLMMERMFLLSPEDCARNNYIDENPCTSHNMIDRAWNEKCHVVPMWDDKCNRETIFEEMADTEEMCSYLFDRTDCITYELRNYGAWCSIHEDMIVNRVYTHIRTMVPSLPRNMYESGCHFEELEVCTDNELLANLIMFTCPIGYHVYENEAAMCFDFVKLEKCGHMVAREVPFSCTEDQVRNALIEHEEDVMSMTGIAPSVCTAEESCFKPELEEIVNVCIPESLMWNHNALPNKCSVYSFMWYCVETSLIVNDVCDPERNAVTFFVESRIKHLLLSEWEDFYNDTAGFYSPFVHCTVSEQFELCDNVEEFSYFVQMKCETELRGLEEEGCEMVDVAVQCALSVLISYQCEQDGREVIAMQALVISARRNYLIIAASCFDARPELGYCPVIQAYNQICNGAYDRCTLGTQCEPGLKCCFDGQAALCTKPATEKAMYEVLIYYEPTQAQEIIATQAQLAQLLFQDIDFEFIKLSDYGPSLVYHTWSYYDPGVFLHGRIDLIVRDPSLNLTLSYNFLSQEIDVEDRCPADLLTDQILRCVEQTYHYYEDYKKCKQVHDIASCVSDMCWMNPEANNDKCDEYRITVYIQDESDDLMMKLQQLPDTYRFKSLLRMLPGYNATYCKDVYNEEDPCWSESIKEDVYTECANQQKLDVLMLSQSSHENLCRALSNFTSCVAIALRKMGSRNCDFYSVAYNMDTYLFKITNGMFGTRYPNGQSILLDSCKDYVPVCSFAGLSMFFDTRYDLNFLRYSGQQNYCSNETVRQAFINIVELTRVTVLLRGEDCSVERMLEIIDSDRYHLRLVSQDEDLTNCVSEEEKGRIMNALPSRDSLCHSPITVNSYRQQCTSMECQIQPTALTWNIRASCALYYQQLGCVQREMMNSSLICDLDDLSTAVQEDMESPLYLPGDLMGVCQDYKDNEFEGCEIHLLSQINGSMNCIENLRQSSEPSCNMVALASTCLWNTAYSLGIQCDPTQITAAMKDIIVGAGTALAQIDCYYLEIQSVVIDDGCATPISYEICAPTDDSEVMPVIELIEKECRNISNNMTVPYRIEPHVDNVIYQCRKLEGLAWCTNHALDRLSQPCPMLSIYDNIILPYADLLPTDLTPQDIAKCYDKCYLAVDARVDECLAAGLHYRMEDMDPMYSDFCGVYDLLWNCVNTTDVADSCRDSEQESNMIGSHLAVELFHSFNDNPQILHHLKTCQVTSSRQKICLDSKMARGVLEQCYMFYSLSEGCSALDDVVDCYRHNIGLFGDCSEDYPVEILIKQTREYQWDHVVHCFGESEDGYCPLQQAMASCRRCDQYDWQMDQCVFDTNCTEGYKCCNDGCKYTCLRIDSAIPVRHTLEFLMFGETLDNETYDVDSQHLWDTAKPKIEALMRVFAPDQVTNISLNQFWLMESGDIYGDAFIFSYSELAKILDFYITFEEHSDETIKFQYIRENLQDLPPKNGSCPAWGIEVSDYDYCCSDNDCSDNLKCCEVGYSKTCMETSPELLELVFLLPSELYEIEYNDTTNPITKAFLEMSSGFLDPLFSQLEINPTFSELRQHLMETQFSVEIVYTVYGSMSLEKKIRRQMQYMEYDIQLLVVNTIGNDSLPSCNDINDLNTIALEKCNFQMMDIGSMLSFSCWDLYSNLRCLNDAVNVKRYLFNECTLGELKNTWFSSVTDMSSANYSSFDIALSSCAEHQLVLSFEAMDCNLNSPESHEMLMVIENVTVWSFDQNEILHTLTTCSYGIAQLYYSVFTNTLSHEVKEAVTMTIENNFWNYIGRLNAEVWTLNDEGFDRCNDVETWKTLTTHCVKQFSTKTYLEHWQICEITGEVIGCVLENIGNMPNRRNIRNCPFNLLYDNSILREDVLNHTIKVLGDNATYSGVVMSMIEYSPEKCVNGDQDPCTTDLDIYYKECMNDSMYANTSLYDVMYENTTQEFCGMYNDLIECVGNKLRSKGKDCGYYEAERVIQSKNHIEYSQIDKCYVWQKVCSVRYLKSMYPCYWEIDKFRHNLYGAEMCSSDEQRSEFGRYLSCLGINALTRNEIECIPSTLLDIIHNDPFNANILSPTFNISSCISESDIQALDAELVYGEGLCTSRQVIQFTGRVSSAPCSLDHIAEVDFSAACSHRRLQLTMIKERIEMIFNIPCDVSAMLGIELLPGSGLSLSDSLRAQCTELMNSADCAMNHYYENYNETINCFTPLFNHTTASAETVCGVRPFILKCLKKMVDNSLCPMNETAVQTVFRNFLKIPDVQNTMWNCSMYEPEINMLPCIGDPLPTDVNTCSDDDFITNVTLLSCPLHEYYFGMYNTSTPMCLEYWKLVECGANTTGVMNIQPFNNTDPKFGCPIGRVNAALWPNIELLNSFFPGMNPVQCQDPCNMNLRGALNECIWPLRETWSYMWLYECRAYKYMHQCVDRAVLKNDGQCSSSTIQSALAKEGFYPGPQCDIVTPISACENLTDFTAIISPCTMYMFNHFEGQSPSVLCSNTTELKNCVIKSISRYTTTPCNQQLLEEFIPRAMATIYIQHFSYIPNGLQAIRECYGIQENPGYCPYISPSMYQLRPGVCSFDYECEDPGMKCCQLGESFNCIHPVSEQASFSVSILTDIPWMPDFWEMSEELKQNITELLFPTLMNLEDISFEISSLDPSYSDEHQMVLFGLDVKSFVGPEALIRGAIQPLQWKILHTSHQFDETQGYCPDHNDYCEDFPTLCGNDYECRALYPHGKCCYGCGSRCIDLGHCIGIAEDAWNECFPQVESTFDKVFNEYEYLEQVYCRSIKEFTSCVESNTMYNDTCAIDHKENGVYHKLLRHYGREDSHWHWAYEDVCNNMPTDECDDIQYLYEKSHDQCYSFAQQIFNEDPTSYHKCMTFSALLQCVKYTLPTGYCDDWVIDNTMQAELYRYFELLRDEYSWNHNEWYTFEPYQCQENRCLNVTEIIKTMSNHTNCEWHYDGVLTSPEVSPEFCRNFSSLTECVVGELRHEYYECDSTQVSRHIAGYLIEELAIDDSAFSYCEGLVCTADKFTQIAQNCSAFDHYRNTGDCSYFEDFMTYCVQPRALMNAETCPLQKILNEMNRWVHRPEFMDVLNNHSDHYPTFQLCPAQYSDDFMLEGVNVHWLAFADEMGERIKYTITTNNITESTALFFAFSETKSQTQLPGMDAFLIRNQGGQYHVSMGWIIEGLTFDEQTTALEEDWQMVYRDGRQQFTFEYVPYGPPILYAYIGSGDVNNDGVFHLSSWLSSDSFFNFTLGERLQQLEQQSMKPLCENDQFIRQTLEFACWGQINTTALNVTDKCFIELYMTGCVYAHLQKTMVGCSFDQVNQTMQKPATRNKIFGPINPICAQLHLTDCDRHILYGTAANAQDCFMPVASLTYSQAMNSSISQIPSADGSGKLLKCSVLEDTIECIQHHNPVTGMESWPIPTTGCDASIYWKMGLSMVSAYSKAAVMGVDMNALISGLDIKPVNFSNCSQPEVLDYDECPLSSTIIEQVVSTCSPGINMYLQNYSMSPCSIGTFVMACANGSVISQRMAACDHPHQLLDNALRMYSDYTEVYLGGYNHISCEGYQECVDHLNFVSWHCFTPYWMIQGDPSVNNSFSEKCAVLHHIENARTADECLLEVAPNCGEHIPQHLENVKIYMNLTELFNNCSTVSGNICDALPLLVKTMCYDHMVDYSYGVDTCKIFDCVEKNVPTECTVDTYNLTVETFFMGYDPGSCMRPIMLPFHVDFMLVNMSFIQQYNNSESTESQELVNMYMPLLTSILDPLMLVVDYTMIMLQPRPDVTNVTTASTSSNTSVWIPPLDGMLLGVWVYETNNPAERIAEMIQATYPQHNGSIALYQVYLPEEAYGPCVEQFGHNQECEMALKQMTYQFNNAEACMLINMMEESVAKCAARKYPVCQQFALSYGMELVKMHQPGFESCSEEDMDICLALEGLGFNHCRSKLDEGHCVIQACFLDVLQEYIDCGEDLLEVANNAVRRFHGMEMIPCDYEAYEVIFLIRNESFIVEYLDTEHPVTIEAVNRFYTMFFAQVLEGFESEFLSFEPANDVATDESDMRRKRQADYPQGLYVRIKVWYVINPEGWLRDRLDNIVIMHGLPISLVAVIAPPPKECDPPCEWNQVCNQGRCSCPDICPAIYDPICAYNSMSGIYETQSNECVFNMKSCYDDQWTYYDDGECEYTDCVPECQWYESCHEGNCTCPQYCNEAFEPVCAFNWMTNENETFPNYCYFYRELCMSPGMFEYQQDGSCESGPSPCSADYFETAITETCVPSWYNFTLYGQCSDYEQFLQCIRFMAVKNEEHCSISEINSTVAERVDAEGHRPHVCEVSGWWNVDAAFEAFYSMNHEANKLDLEIHLDQSWDFSTTALMIGIAEPEQLEEMDVTLIRRLQADNMHVYYTATHGSKYGEDLNFPEIHHDVPVGEMDSELVLYVQRDIQPTTSSEDFNNLTISGQKLVLAYAVTLHDDYDIVYNEIARDHVVFDRSMLLESQMPFTMNEACTNVVVVRHILQYYCYNLDYIIVEGNDKCMVEIRMRYCVYFKVADMGCAMDQVFPVFTSMELRHNLLSTEPECENQLPMCMNDLMLNRVIEIYDPCLAGAGEWLWFEDLDSLEALDGSPLKCKIYELTVQCSINILTPDLGECVMNDFHLALISVLMVGYESDEQHVPPNSPQIYDSCTDNLSMLDEQPVCPNELLYDVLFLCGNDARISAEAGSNDCDLIYECTSKITGKYPNCEGIEALAFGMLFNETIIGAFEQITGYQYVASCIDAIFIATIAIFLYSAYVFLPGHAVMMMHFFEYAFSTDTSNPQYDPELEGCYSCGVIEMVKLVGGMVH